MAYSVGHSSYLIANSMKHWYVIHSKPREEQRALDNLQAQGYDCYLPLLAVEKLRRGKRQQVQEPLFARYLFIHLDSSPGGHNWAPIRSSRGVSRLVSFGNVPARVDDAMIAALRAQLAASTAPVQLFQPGEAVEITDGPFAGLSAIFDIADGDSRALVLLELLSKPTRVPLLLSQLRKAG